MDVERCVFLMNIQENIETTLWYSGRKNAEPPSYDKHLLYLSFLIKLLRGCMIDCM